MTSATVTDISKIKLNENYPDAITEIAIEAHTVKVTVDDGGFVKTFADDSTSEFTALQFHFHAPSENTIDGKHMDLEMHIVH